MSRGAPQTQMLSAVNPQTTQTLAATGQVANQAAANRNQAMAIQARQQMQREQAELARQMGAQRNAVQMAGIAEQARSQAEYRDLLRDKAEMENQIARDAQAQRANQFQQDMDFRKSQYDEVLRMQDEQLELDLASAKSAGEAREEQRRKAQSLREQANALIVRMTAANEMMEKGIDDINPILNSFVQGGEEKLMTTQIIADRVNAGVAEGLTVDGLIGREGMRDFLGAELGITEEAFGNLGQYFNPLRLGVDDANVRQTMILRALGEDFYDPTIVDEVGLSTLQEVSPVDLKERMHLHVAGKIAGSMAGLDEQQRGVLAEGIRKAFDAAGDNASTVKQGQAILAKAAKDAGVDLLVLNTAIAGAGNALQSRREAFDGMGLPDTYANFDADINEIVTDEGFVGEFGQGRTQFDAFASP